MIVGREVRSSSRASENLYSRTSRPCIGLLEGAVSRVDFFVLQGALVATIAVITVILWLRTSSPSFLVAAGAMYYWSLHGAWGIIIDHSGGDSGLHYQYLEQDLFPIRLDSNYFWALSLYGFFIIVTLLTVLVFSRRDVKGLRPNIEPVRVSPGVLLAISAVFAVAALG
jgi:hypothetical protein